MKLVNDQVYGNVYVRVSNQVCNKVYNPAWEQVAALVRNQVMGTERGRSI